MEPVLEFQKHTPPDHKRPVRLIRKPELLGMVGLGNTSLYDLIKRGEFPAPLRLSARSVAWREDEVQAWIAARPRSLGSGAGK